MGNCNTPCTPCNENNLGCIHYHNTDCIKLKEEIGDFPAGTDLQTFLESINSAEDGVSVVDAQIVGGELIIYLSDNTEINVGNVVGATGANGTNGTNGTNGVDGTNGTNGTDGVGIDTITTNTNGAIVVTLTDSTVITLPNAGQKTYFFDSHENPNTATSIDPLLSWVDSAVIDNKTTITPTIGSVGFQVDTKEIYIYTGISWVNPMSMGNHLLHTSFGHNYNSVSSPSTALITQYTPPFVLEDGEKYRVKFSGTIYSGVNIKVEINDGTTAPTIGFIGRVQEGDPYENRFSVTLDITRKSSSTYISCIDGIVQADTSSILLTATGSFFPFTRTLASTSMDTTVVPSINIFGVSTVKSPVQSDAIVLEVFSVEKIKF